MFIKLRSLIIVACGLILASCRSQGWTQISPENTPPASGQGAIAFVDSSNTAILFGGITVDRWLNETWIWSEKTWYQALPENSPPARAKLAMEYDKSRDKVVLFGGIMDKTLFDDTWEWDGQDWQLMKPIHKPPARCCHGMAYDIVNKDIIMYGGYDPNRNIFLSDIWKWDGADWIVIPSDMPAMSGHAMISSLVDNEIISVQTAGYGTWAWDGKTWKSAATENPPHRSEGKIAYDGNNQRIIFFGGIADNQILNDTWVLDGRQWSSLSLSNDPPARYGHILFYDPDRESIILFGGIGNGNTRFGDMWELKLPSSLSNLVDVLPKYDGDWKGTTSQDLEIVFTVAHNDIVTMKFGAEWEGPNCSKTFETKIETKINPTAEASGNFTSVHPIENGTFTITQDNSSSDGTAFTFVGTFSSPEKVSGTIEYAATSGTCQGIEKFNWTATKIAE